jgi:hypothetical protein
MRFGNVESFLARKGFYGKSVKYYTIESTYNILRNVYKLKVVLVSLLQCESTYKRLIIFNINKKYKLQSLCYREYINVKIIKMKHKKRAKILNDPYIMSV